VVGGGGDLGGHRLRGADEHVVAPAGGLMPGLPGERGLPDAGRQAGSRRVEFLVGAVDRVAVKDRGERVEGAQVPGFLPVRIWVEVDPQGGGDRRPAAIGDAELKPPAADRVEHRGVLGDPDHVLQRQRHHRGPEPDPRGTASEGAEKRRRQPAGKAEPGGAARPGSQNPFLPNEQWCPSSRPATVPWRAAGCQSGHPGPVSSPRAG
jgi:hypothetical protein